MSLLILMFFPDGLIFRLLAGPTLSLPMGEQRGCPVSLVLVNTPAPHMDTQTHSYPGSLAWSSWEDNSTESQLNRSDPEGEARLFTRKGSSCERWERSELSGLLFCCYSSLSFVPSNSTYKEYSYNPCALNYLQNLTYLLAILPIN